MNERNRQGHRLFGPLLITALFALLAACGQDLEESGFPDIPPETPIGDPNGTNEEKCVYLAKINCQRAAVCGATDNVDACTRQLVEERNCAGVETVRTTYEDCLDDLPIFDCAQLRAGELPDSCQDVMSAF